MTTTLDELRKAIDALDDQILPLLNRRAELAMEIGRIKKQVGAPLHVPSRERDVINRLVSRNTGPMTATAITEIYRAIMAAALELEHQEKGP